jgi:phasin family protein
MQNDFLKNIETLNKAAIESARRLGDINVRTLEKLAQRQIEATADYLEGGVKQLKLMGESKDIQAAVKEQAHLTTELNEKFVEHAKKTAEVMDEIKDELTDWAQDGMKAVGVPSGNGAKKPV